MNLLFNQKVKEIQNYENVPEFYHLLVQVLRSSLASCESLQLENNS